MCKDDHRASQLMTNWRAACCVPARAAGSPAVSTTVASCLAAPRYATAGAVMSLVFILPAPARPSKPRSPRTALGMPSAMPPDAHSLPQGACPLPGVRRTRVRSTGPPTDVFPRPTLPGHTCGCAEPAGRCRPSVQCGGRQAGCGPELLCRSTRCAGSAAVSDWRSAQSSPLGDGC